MLLNKHSTEWVKIHAIDAISTRFKLQKCLIKAAQKKRQSDIGGLAKSLKL